MGLLDGVKGMMTNAVVDKVSDVLGIENGMLKSAMKMFLPAVIGGVISKGSSPSGAGGLMDLFKKGGYGDDNLGDIMGVLGNEDKRSGWMDTGADLLGTIFGNSQSGIMDMLLSKTGLGKGAGGMLLKFLAPLVINKLAGVVKGNNMDAAGLSSYLSDQKSDVMGLIPGFGKLLGGAATANLGAAVHSAKETVEAHDNDSGGGMGFLKWLLPLALLGLAAWFFTRDKKADAPEPAKTEMKVEKKAAPATTTKKVEANNDATTTETTTAEVKAATDYTGYDVNDNLDIVTASGAVVHSSGSYDVDKNNNILDGNGRMLIPAASLPDAFKTKITSMFDRIRLARMKMMFGNMIVKKAGAKTSYGLSDIKFKKEGHRIAGFSKAEVEGLAAALKANATGKIEVHVHTADGKDDKENADFADKRANVIRDMLVTLGVNKDQISAVGKGNGDAAKAAVGKVDIVVK